MATASDGYQLLKEEVRIDDYLRSLVDSVKEDRRTGRLRSKCPIHDGNNPTALSVDPERGLFHCFACGAKGSVIDLYAAVNDLEVGPELLARMSSEFRVKLPERERVRAVTRREVTTALNDIAERCHQLMFPPNGDDPSGDALTAREYLLSRIPGKEMRETFPSLGLIGFLDRATLRGIERDYRMEVLEAAGFISPRPGGHYSRVLNRLLFPVMDSHRDVIAISGRVVPSFTDQGGEERGPIATVIDSKYLNPTNGVAYNKSSDLYGADVLSGTGASRVVVVEGYMDALAINSELEQAGVNNCAAVAICGTAFTEEHARFLLDSGVEQVFFMTDGDSAGAGAVTSSVWAPYMFPDMSFHSATGCLPDGADPFDVIVASTDGASLLERALADASRRSLEREAIESQLSTLGPDGELDKFFRWCRTVYRRIEDPRERRRFVRDVAQTTGTPTGRVAAQLSVRDRHRRDHGDSTIPVSPSGQTMIHFVMSALAPDSQGRDRVAHSLSTMSGISDLVFKTWFRMDFDYEVEALISATEGLVPKSREAQSILADMLSDESQDSGAAMRSLLVAVTDGIAQSPEGRRGGKRFSSLWSSVNLARDAAARARELDELVLALCLTLEAASALMQAKVAEEG